MRPLVLKDSCLLFVLSVLWLQNEAPLLSVLKQDAFVCVCVCVCLPAGKAPAQEHSEAERTAEDLLPLTWTAHFCKTSQHYTAVNRFKDINNESGFAYILLQNLKSYILWG